MSDESVTGLVVTVVGSGATGARAAHQLVASPEVAQVRLVEVDGPRRRRLLTSLGERAVDAGERLEVSAPGEVVILAVPDGYHRLLADEALAAGAHVVSSADSISEVEALLELDATAREQQRRVVVGAGFAPGLTCLLARHGSALFDGIDEIHVAKAGTGGPACARTHHRALGSSCVDFRDGVWVDRRGGSGRELVWFPDPVGARDCYRAALPDPHLLVPAFPGVSRVTSRLSATRRDRLTSRLPMLRPPHAEGGPGAIRVELRGRRGGAKAVMLLGAMHHPAVAAGAVAAVAAVAAGSGQLGPAGARGLASVSDPLPLLRELARRGVSAAAFDS